MQELLRKLKRKKSLLPAKEVVFVIFFQNEAASEITNPLVVPGFSLCPSTLILTLPCPYTADP